MGGYFRDIKTSESQAPEKAPKVSVAILFSTCQVVVSHDGVVSSDYRAVNAIYDDYSA